MNSDTEGGKANRLNSGSFEFTNSRARGMQHFLERKTWRRELVESEWSGSFLWANYRHPRSIVGFHWMHQKATMAIFLSISSSSAISKTGRSSSSLSRRLYIRSGMWTWLSVSRVGSAVFLQLYNAFLTPIRCAVLTRPDCFTLDILSYGWQKPQLARLSIKQCSERNDLTSRNHYHRYVCTVLAPDYLTISSFLTLFNIRQ